MSYIQPPLARESRMCPPCWRLLMAQGGVRTALEPWGSICLLPAQPRAGLVSYFIVLQSTLEYQREIAVHDERSLLGGWRWQQQHNQVVASFHSCSCRVEMSIVESVFSMCCSVVVDVYRARWCFQLVHTPSYTFTQLEGCALQLPTANSLSPVGLVW